MRYEIQTSLRLEPCAQRAAVLPASGPGAGDQIDPGPARKLQWTKRWHSGRHVQDRLLDVKEGDLFVAGNNLFHRLIYTGTRVKAPRIMFLPQLICPTGATSDDTDYLRPFLVQDTGFPHFVPARTGLSRQIRTLMTRIHDRPPDRPPRACAPRPT